MTNTTDNSIEDPLKSIFKNTTRAKIGNRWFVPIEEIEQALQSHLKRAELRARIDELKQGRRSIVVNNRIAVLEGKLLKGL